MTRPIFLLSDFGTRDHYAGQVRAVLVRLAPGSQVLDITHDIEPFAIDEGAWMLEVTLPHLPAEAVVFGVVDPGVGGQRAAIAVRDADGRLLVGPDNGLFSGALPPRNRRAGRALLAGSGVEARAFTPLGVGIDPRLISPTFHGRDLFAPAAAALASGVPFAALGGAVDAVEALAPFEAVARGPGTLGAAVVHVDAFGNLLTTLRMGQVAAAEAVTLVVEGRTVARRITSFEEAAPGEVAWHEDSSGFVAIAVSLGSAADLLGARRGTTVEVRLE